MNEKWILSSVSIISGTWSSLDTTLMCDTENVHLPSAPRKQLFCRSPRAGDGDGSSALPAAEWRGSVGKFCWNSLESAASNPGLSGTGGGEGARTLFWPKRWVSLVQVELIRLNDNCVNSCWKQCPQSPLQCYGTYQNVLVCCFQRRDINSKHPALQKGWCEWDQSTPYT